MKQQKFITESNLVHNCKYDYSKTVYVNAHTKVTITCPIHGDFEQRPFSHKNSAQGCPDCGHEQRSLKRQTRKVGIEEFVKKATAIHGNIYDYSNTVYISAKSNLTILCPIHGEFEQKPNNHLNGSGCPKCSAKGYSDTEWGLLGTKSKHFTGFKLYIIECWSETEHFIKVGKTFTDISKRFSNRGAMPYDWKLLYIEEGSAKYISEIERELQKNIYTYMPKRPFSGQTECFTLEIKEQLPMVLK